MKQLDVLHGLSKPPRRELLFGPAGCGKTTYAVMLSPEAERVTIYAGMFADSLFGKFLLAKGSTVWVDGPATRAARKGVPLILDELDHQTGEIESALRCILDDPSVCRFNLDSGEQVTPQKGYQCNCHDERNSGRFVGSVARQVRCLPALQDASGRPPKNAQERFCGVYHQQDVE